MRETGAEFGLSAIEDSWVDFDHKVAALSLGHDATTDHYMILAQVSDDEQDAIALWMAPDVLDWMADRAFEVHDSGRRRCPLCDAPLRDGKHHACPRAN